MAARCEGRLVNLQRQLSRPNLLSIDELGFIPLSRTGAEMRFEILSQLSKRGRNPVTEIHSSDKWPETLS